MAKNSRNQKLLVRGGLLFLWLGVIFFLSQMPGSGTTGEPPFWYVLERKSGHVFEYGVLMFLAFRFFWILFWRESFLHLLFLSGAFALAYGATDELHQFFVFGRGANLSDVAVDLLGILMVGIVLWLLWREKNAIMRANRG